MEVLSNFVFLENNKQCVLADVWSWRRRKLTRSVESFKGPIISYSGILILSPYNELTEEFKQGVT